MSPPSLRVPSTPAFYILFCVATVLVLKEVNSIVWEPYMDEPFHVAQSQAYCRGEWTTWDPKITTPPGLYIEAAILRYIFMFKCRLPLLRLVPALHLMALPILISILEAYHKRLPPPTDLTEPSLFSITTAMFPLLWFFGHLFYTDVPSLFFVLASFVAQTLDAPWTAASLGAISLLFRQTNIIWIIYVFAFHQISGLRWLRSHELQSGDEKPLSKLYDPSALSASLWDIPRSIGSILRLTKQLLPRLLPCASVCVLFICFLVWNGGIVLGDKSHHTLSLNIPQLFYFYGFASGLGWPILFFGGKGTTRGPIGLVRTFYYHASSTTRQRLVSLGAVGGIYLSISYLTIHHPFILSDNRHYVFYIWRRILFRNTAMPFLLSPIYYFLVWAWWIRAADGQSLLQALLIPATLLPTLLPTPLLEPRYFITPYVLLRLQIQGSNDEDSEKDWLCSLLPWIEVLWYLVLNLGTMYTFLYGEQPILGSDSVTRFMW